MIDNSFEEVFDKIKFGSNLYDKLSEQFTIHEWTIALIYSLRSMFPQYAIERIGGKNNKHFGPDILIKLPSIFPSREYFITIHIVDYQNIDKIDHENLIAKIRDNWQNEQLKLIETIVIVTNTNENDDLDIFDCKTKITYILADKLKQLVTEIGYDFIIRN